MKIKEDITSRMKRAADKKRDQEELDCMAKVEEMLNKGVMVKDGAWSAREVDYLNKHLFLTSKLVPRRSGVDDYFDWVSKKRRLLKSI